MKKRYRQYKKISERVKRYQRTISPILASKKGRAYTAITLSFFTMAFFAFFAIKPTLTTIAQLNKEIDDSRKVDERLTDKIKSLIRAQADYELISGAIPLLDEALPSSPEFIQTLLIIEKAARVTDATVSSLTVDKVVLSTASAAPVDKKGEPTSISFSLAVSGVYENLVRFITFLVSNPRIMKVESMSITSVDKEDSVSIEVKAKTQAFYYYQLKNFDYTSKAGESSNDQEEVTSSSDNEDTFSTTTNK